MSPPAKRRGPGARRTRPTAEPRTGHHAGTPTGYPSWRDEVERAADIALATGQIVVVHPHDVVVIPDVASLEVVANGGVIGADTTVLVDPDTGRTCRLYRASPEVVAALAPDALTVIVLPR